MPNVVFLGYAVPFNQTVKVGAGYERFASGAFSDFVASVPKNIAVTFDGHERDTPRIGIVRGFFEDQFGLGFWADVDEPWVRRITSRGFDRASVGGLLTTRTKSDFDLGARRTTVVSATIDHVAICGDAAAYADTAVWPQDKHARTMRLSGRLGRLSSEFDRGLTAAWTAAERKRAVRESKEAKIVAMLASRRLALAKIQNAMKQRPGQFDGMIMGHLAFSKYAKKV